MKIILKEDIANLGYKDDVVEVKNGYGRNYLIPTGKAVIATESALKVLAETSVSAPTSSPASRLKPKPQQPLFRTLSSPSVPRPLLPVLFSAL